jgi:hypothetical protein
LHEARDQKAEKVNPLAPIMGKVFADRQMDDPISMSKGLGGHNSFKHVLLFSSSLLDFWIAPGKLTK